MMNKGTAVVGFFLCFMAGMALMYGVDHSRKGYDLSAESGQAPHGPMRRRPYPSTAKTPCGAIATRRSRSSSSATSSARSARASSRRSIRSRRRTARTRSASSGRTSRSRSTPTRKPAAEAAQGVFALGGNDAFWKFHDTAFKNQQAPQPESYEKWASEAGVKTRRSSRPASTRTRWADKVDEDMRRRQERRRQRHARVLHQRRRALAARSRSTSSRRSSTQQLAKAQAAIASGHAKADKVYVEMSKENKAKRSGASPRRPRRRSAPKEDDKTVWKVPVGDCAGPRARQTRSSPSSSSPTSSARSASASETTLKKVHETYGDKVRLVWKHKPLPFHPRAEPAAELALEARAREGRQGLLGRARQALRAPAEARRRRPRRRRQGPRPRRRQGQGRDRAPQVQGGDRRRRRPRRRRPGQRHAALLHQRPPPRRRAAVREVQGRSSTRRSRRPRRSSPRASRPRTSTTRS